MRFPLSLNKNCELRIYSPVTCPSRPIVCSTTSRLKVCWFKASRTCVSVLRKAARIVAGVVITGGAAASEATSTFDPVLLDRNEAIEPCWAIADGVENMAGRCELPGCLALHSALVATYFKWTASFQRVWHTTCEQHSRAALFCCIYALDGARQYGYMPRPSRFSPSPASLTSSV